MKTQVMLITPDMAEAMLENNRGNRNVRLSWVKQLAVMMERGEFKTTHQGIAFASNGRLLDGQHRLLAVVESGMSVKMMVTQDAEEDLFTALDIGAKRSFSDMYGATSDESAITGWLSTLMFFKPSPIQAYQIFKIVQPFIHDMMTFCPTKKKGLTSSKVASAAIIRMLNGEDQEYIKLIYWNIAHSAISELPPIGRCFVDQIYATIGSNKRLDNYDTFARAIRVFDKTISDKRRIVITSHLEATDFARDVLGRYLEEKKPASKAPVSTRAKSTKL